MSSDLSWLPACADWPERLAALKGVAEPETAWAGLVALAKFRLDFLETARLDREAQRMVQAGRIHRPQAIRVALLGSSTLKHLVAGLRIAGLRRGLWFEVYEGGYGQYLQEVLEEGSPLEAFRPEFCCFALDAQHLLDLMDAGPQGAIERVELVWRTAQERFGATMMQQAALPRFGDTLGNNEHRMADSAAAKMMEFNTRLRPAADAAGVALLAVDRYCALGGIDVWHDAALWHLAKQEVHPALSPLYGDLLARLVAAQRGRSAKCLVLDLDNTLWGGVVGDDGVDGILISHGHALGEAHLAFQRYCLQLKERGIVLAVCSKNDEANAREPFQRRPEMLLKEADFACFLANWNDKATNLREIASRLKIGTDALVFADDNPAERELIRRELPEVMVPELPADPAGYALCVARAGYFEGLTLTADDRERAERYRENAAREAVRSQTTDLQGYLRGLAMELSWRPYDEGGLARIVQLSNKTNQFNLMTTRLSEAETRALMADPCVMSWQVRLKDRFGDNGVIALIHGRLSGEEFVLEQWLMSCRVLGRGVEAACLNLVMEAASARGAKRVIGLYRPTAKNGMVRDLFARLGFAEVNEGGVETHWTLAVAEFVPREIEMTVLPD